MRITFHRSSVLLVSLLLGAAPLIAQAPEAWPDQFPYRMIESSGALSYYFGEGEGNYGGQLLDADADGHLDVFHANLVYATGGSTLLLQLNLGGGQFEERLVATLDSPPLRPRRLASGDLDGDGDLDLLGLDIGWLVTLLRDADGNYVQTVRAVSAASTAWAVDDLTGDGVLDVLLLHRQDSEYRVVLLTGLGDGSFGDEVLVAHSADLSNMLAFVAVGDLDGDGDADIVVSLGSRILKHLTGPAGFGPPQSVASALSGRFMDPTLTDLDGDGRLDLVVVEYGGAFGSISWWPGLGTGDFGPRVDRIIEDELFGLLVSDLNVDGRPDLLAVGQEGTYVLRAGPDFGYGPTKVYPEFHGVNAARLGDITGDGLPDLVLDPYTSRMRVMVGRGDASFEHLPILDSGATAANLTDMDGDGWLDLALGFPDRVEVRPGLPGGGFGAPSHSVATTALVAKVTWANVNGDDLPDLVIFTKNPAFMGSQIALGGGKFAGLVIQGLALQHSSPAMHDVNEDGLDDVAYLGNSNVFLINLGNGDGTFTPVPYPVAISQSGVDSFVLAHLNGDDHLDLAFVKSNDGLYVRAGRGNGNFIMANTVIAPPDPSPQTGTTFDVGDLDHDGILDLVVCTDLVRVLKGQGDGKTFVEVATAPGNANVRVADVDGDGHLDVLEHRHQVRLLFGDGTGALHDAGQGRFVFTTEIDDLVLGDVDADGDLDVLPVYHWFPFGSTNYSLGVGDVVHFDQRRRWEQRGVGVEGAAGHATLGGVGTLEAGSPVRVVLQSGAPGAPALMILSVNALDFPTLGGVLVPAPDILLGGLPIGADGVLDLGGTWPAAVPGGVEVFLQAWFPDGTTTWGWAATPGLVLVTP